MKLRQKNVNELKAGSILTYVNLFISCIIPLFYTPIMLDILGQEEYGLYSLSNSVISYLSILTFGMGSAVIRYITKCRVDNDHEMLERTAGMFVFIYAILAGLVCFTGVVLTNFTGFFFGKGLSGNEIDKMKVLMVIMTLSTAFSFLSSVYASIINAYEKYIFRKTIDSLGTIAAPVLNLVVLIYGYASVGMALIGLIIQIVYLVLFVLYCAKKLNVRPRFRNMPLYLFWEIAGFSAFVFLSSLVDMLYWATDKVLIGALLGTAAVAVYNIGGTFTGMLQNMSSAISGVFGTRVTQIVLSEQPVEELSKLLIRIGRLQYLIVSFFLSGYIVFGRSFIRFWAGDAYAEAYYIGLMTMLPLAIPLIQNIAFATIVAQNKHRFRAGIYAAIAVVNVISTYLVLPYWGIIGAGACTAIAFLVGNGLIMNIYYYKVTKLDIPLFWKNILKMSIVPVLSCILSECFIHYILPINTIQIFIAYVIIFSGVFMFFTWKITMNEYEKWTFKDLIMKIRKNSKI